MDERTPFNMSGETVTPNEGEVNEATAAENAGGEQAAAAEQPEQREQSHEDNRRYQAARMAGERAGKEAAEREFVKRLAALGMRDQSGKEVTTIEDLEQFGKQAKRDRQMARAKKENRPLADIEREDEDAEYLARKRREDSEREKQERSAREESEFIARDLRDFREAHPEVDVEALDANKAFRKFCGTRYGRQPLSELYEDYVELVGEAQASAQMKAASKAERSTGSGGGSGAEALTAEEQKALDAWNERYPGMKMTAKEFKSR